MEGVGTVLTQLNVSVSRRAHDQVTLWGQPARGSGMNAGGSIEQRRNKIHMKVSVVAIKHRWDSQRDGRCRQVFTLIHTAPSITRKTPALSPSSQNRVSAVERRFLFPTSARQHLMASDTCRIRLCSPTLMMQRVFQIPHSVAVTMITPVCVSRSGSVSSILAWV